MKNLYLPLLSKFLFVETFFSPVKDSRESLRRHHHYGGNERLERHQRLPNLLVPDLVTVGRMHTLRPSLSPRMLGSSRRKPCTQPQQWEQRSWKEERRGLCRLHGYFQKLRACIC